jgi:hypothetical protein
MKKEELRVGMVITRRGRFNPNKVIKSKVNRIEGDHVYIDEEYSIPAEDLKDWEPAIEKRKVKLYRYTHLGPDIHVRQTSWISQSWEEIGYHSTLVKTEEKEIEVEEQP